MNTIFLFTAIFLIAFNLTAADLFKKELRQSAPIFFSEKQKCGARLSDSILCSAQQGRQREAPISNTSSPHPITSPRREYPQKEDSFIMKVNSNDVIKRIDGKRQYVMGKMIRGQSSQDLNAPLKVHLKLLKQDEKGLSKAMTTFFSAYNLGYEKAEEEIYSCFEQIINLQGYKNEILAPHENWGCGELSKAIKIVATLYQPSTTKSLDTQTIIWNHRASLIIGKGMNKSSRPNLQLIYVSDIARSTNFYRDLFKIDPVFSSPHYVAFPANEQGDALFALWDRAKARTFTSPHFGEIGIMVPTNSDVDNLFESWRGIKDLIVKQEPFDEVFGRTFIVQDPDGHLIRVSPGD